MIFLAEAMQAELRQVRTRSAFAAQEVNYHDDP